MSVKVIGTKARVHYSTKHNSSTLTNEQGILYVCPKGLGQAGVKKNSAGLTPAQLFEERYDGQKSSLMQDLVADDIFVFDKTRGSNFDYDDECRKLINELYNKKIINFHANVNATQTPNTNSEALLGYEREQHLSVLIDIIKQVLGLSNTFDTKIPFTPRYGQVWAIDNIYGGLQKHDKVLFAGYTGIGKSKIALEAIHQYFSAGALILITTPISETITSFVEAVRDTRFGNFPKRTTSIYTTKNMPTISDLQQKAKMGDIVIVIGTVQDVRYQDSKISDDYDIREKYSELCDIIDLWVRDEYHKEYGGEVTKKVFSNVKTKKRLDLTATPYSVIDEYDEDQIVARTLMWAIDNRAYTEVPQFSVDCLSGMLSNNMGKYADVFNESEGFHSHKLVEQNSTTGEFVNFGIIEDIIERAYCRTNFPRTKNQFSISNDDEISLNARDIGLWIMPEGANGVSASEYIVALTNKLNQSTRVNDHVMITNAYDIDRLRGHDTVERYISTMKDHRRLIILTHGKFKTGTDIPALGHIVLLDTISNIAEFEQTVGRIERVYDGKEFTKMYVFSPSITIKEVIARLAHENTKLMTDQERTEQDFLSCFPITEYDGISITRLHPDEIFKQFQQKILLGSALRDFKLPNEIRDLIETNQEIIDQLSTLAKKGGRKSMTKRELTENNKAEVFANTGLFNDLSSDEESSKSKKKQMKLAETNLFYVETTVNQIMDGLTDIWTNVPPFAMIAKNDNVVEVLQCKPLVEMFGVDKISKLVEVINANTTFKKKLQQRLDLFLTAFRGADPLESYDTIFKNCEQKKKQGLVFTPFSLVNDVLENLPMDSYNAKYGS